MIEAQILCNEPCRIEDLNLHLQRGQEQWVAESLARKSKDLRKAQQAGKVSVYYRVVDHKKPRRHAPPNYQRNRPKPRVVQEPEPVVEREVVVEKVVEKIVEKAVEPDTAAIAAEIRAEIIGDVKSVIAQEIAKAMAEAQSAPQQAQSPMTAEMMAQVMETVLKRHTPVQTGGVVIPSKSAQKPEEDAPLYMPTGIVDKDAKAAISVQEKTKEGADDLDENARLLREMRRKRKKNGDK
jgi:hypothetical protein